MRRLLRRLHPGVQGVSGLIAKKRPGGWAVRAFFLSSIQQLDLDLFVGEILGISEIFLVDVIQ